MIQRCAEIAFAILLFVFATYAQGSGSRNLPPGQELKSVPVEVPRFSSAPAIDGNLDEDVWKSAAQFANFIQTEPGYLIPASRVTVAYMGYDSENLYIAYYCYDDPAQISYSVAKRDAVSSEDYVGVFLDTFDDQRRAYIFQFNPLGIQADGIRTAGSTSSDFSPDFVLESKGAIKKDGWVVEVRIPFRSLRYNAGKGVYWGVDFWRRIDRLNREVDGWQPMQRGVPELQQLGKITGLEGIDEGRTLEVVPSITFSQEGERIADASIVPDASRIENHSPKGEFGVSIKYQIKPTVTFDAAINPDFAEVEADAPVVRANERFPIFFAEKRPFFLEGKDYFDSPLQVVNTRTIANPDVALKLTGKLGKNTFGILGAVDDFPDRNQKAFVGIARYKRDVGQSSNIGFFATQYHFGSKVHNQLAGVDASFQLDDANVFSFQVVGTHTKGKFYDSETDDVQYRAGNGLAYTVTFDNTERNTGWLLNVAGKTADYRALAGFTRRTNVHSVNFGFRLQDEPTPDQELIQTTLRGFSSASIDGQGRFLVASIEPRLSFNFQDQLEFGFSGGIGKEKLYEDEFGRKRNISELGAFYGEPERSTVQFFGGFDISKRFNKKLKLEGDIGFTKNSFDLDFGAGEKYPRVSPAALAGDSRLDPGIGFLFNYQVEATYQPTEPMKIDFSYERERLKRYDTNRIAFDSNIYSTRVTYQFTRFIFTRARLDYETTEGAINSQVLFGWSPNPGTAFYAGYNDNSFYRGYNNFSGQFDEGFRRDGRSFFIRFSYLFRHTF
ncbi:MAG: carbohydrate binding family 9 domain-containing protein [Pyrinomonadaceae bacterium]